jgi:CheY-like chemotaxis protein
VRILVVEDDPTVREFVVETLREEGHSVIHAAHGEQALAWCKRRVADVLITDIKLPVTVDGWQIAERCREHESGLASDLCDCVLACRAAARVRQPFLQKPYHSEHIVQAVKDVTAGPN